MGSNPIRATRRNPVHHASDECLGGRFSARKRSAPRGALTDRSGSPRRILLSARAVMPGSVTRVLVWRTKAG